MINLLDVTPERDEQGVYVTLSDQKVRLDAGYEGFVGTDAIIGLRPEILRFAEQGIPVEIEAETPFNEKAVTLTQTKRGREIFVSRPAGTPAPSSGMAHLAVEGSGAILFSRKTGNRIAPTPTPGAEEQAA